MTSGLLNSGKLLDGCRDDVQTLPELSLGNDQRRGKSNDIAVGRFGLPQDALVRSLS